MIAVERVPTLSIIFMAVSALISIGLPIGLFIFFRKKLHMKAIPMVVGATSFVVAVLVLESIMHAMILRPDASGEVALRSKPVLYMLYGGFAAGIFEETARLVCFLLLRKKYKGVGTGIAYGIGHGGIEAILLVGLSMISNMLLSFMSASVADGSFQSQASELIATIASTESYLFLISGFERFIAIALQLSLSVIVWYAVNNKALFYLYPVAILIHAVVDFPAALLQAGAISSFALVEVLALISSAATAFAAFKIHNRNKNFTVETLA